MKKILTISVLLFLIGLNSVFSQVPTDGLVGYWPFNGNANDESGNGITGTVYGASLTIDRFGNDNSAYSFDGDDWIETLENFSLDIPNVTFCAWFYCNDNHQTYRPKIVAINVSSTTNVMQIERHVNNGIYANALPYTGLTTPEYLFQYDTWNFVAVTYDGTNLIIYFNGINVAEDNIAGNYSIVNQKINIGRQINPIGNYWSGKIDDIRYYDRALTDDEIMNIYYEGESLVIIVNPVSQTVCKGDYVNFQIEAQGAEPIFYQWQKNGVDIPNATGNIYSLSNVQPSDEGSYQCVVTNEYGTSTSEEAFLTVETVLPTAIFGPIEVDVYQVATYSVTSHENHEYDFWVEGGNILQTNENNIQVQWGVMGYGYVYMQETNENGCQGEVNILEVAIGSVGIEEDLHGKIMIFPNPVSNTLHIKIPNYDLSNNYSLMIENFLGQIVFNKSLDQNNESFDIGNKLVSGIYTLKIFSSDEIILIRKIIVK